MDHDTGAPDAAAQQDDHQGYELAQLNIGRILAPLDSPQLAG